MTDKKQKILLASLVVLVPLIAYQGLTAAGINLGEYFKGSTEQKVINVPPPEPATPIAMKTEKSLLEIRMKGLSKNDETMEQLLSQIKIEGLRAEKAELEAKTRLARSEGGTTDVIGLSSNPMPIPENIAVPTTPAAFSEFNAARLSYFDIEKLKAVISVGRDNFTANRGAQIGDMRIKSIDPQGVVISHISTGKQRRLTPVEILRVSNPIVAVDK